MCVKLTHTHSTHAGNLFGAAFLLLLYTSIFCVWVPVHVVHVEWEWGGGGGIKQYRLWAPLGRISKFPGIGSSLRKQESVTFPPNNKGGTGKIKGEWGWRGKKKQNKTKPPHPRLGKQVHPVQTISFLLLFAEFRNKIKQYFTPPLSGVVGGGGDLQGCSGQWNGKDNFSAYVTAKELNLKLTSKKKSPSWPNNKEPWAKLS